MQGVGKSIFDCLRLFFNAIALGRTYFKNNMIPSDEKSKLLSVMTVLLMLLVIIGHVSRIFSSYGAFSSNSNLNDCVHYFDFLTDFLYSFHMPVFIAISGGVYYLTTEELKKVYHHKKFLVTKLYRLILPYYAFLFIVVTPSMLITGLINVRLLPGFIFNNIFFIGDNRHLWYLPTLFFIFLIFDLITKHISKNSIVLLFH